MAVDAVGTAGCDHVVAFGIVSHSRCPISMHEEMISRPRSRRDMAPSLIPPDVLPRMMHSR
jgi:hypothetical protein